MHIYTHTYIHTHTHTHTHTYIYIYIRINCKCIIATNSFMCVITIFRLYNVEEKLSYVTLIRSLIKCKLMEKVESDVLKSKYQIKRLLLYSNQHVKRIPLSNYHVNSDDFYLALFKINLLLCLHFDISSVLLFNTTFGSARAIIMFSVRYKSHLLVPHLYRDAYDSILHFRWSIWIVPCR